MQDLTERLKLTPELAVKVEEIIKAGEERKDKMKPEGDRWDSPQAMRKFFIRPSPGGQGDGAGFGQSAHPGPVG